MSAASSSTPALPPAPAERPRNGRPAGLPVFLLALLIGVSLHLGVLILFRFSIDSPTKTTARPPAPFVYFNDIAHNPALQTLITQAQFSPEQTFLSTEKNFSAQALSPSPAPTHPVFGPIAPQLDQAEVDFKPLHPTSLATGPHDALKPLQWDLLGSIGIAPASGAKLAPRGAFVRITRLDMAASPTPPIDITWPSNLAPPTSTGSWQPVGFLLQFNAIGLVGEPVLEPGLDALSQSTAPNDADVNNFLREQLRDWLIHHPPLPPGHYEAVVGP